MKKLLLLLLVFSFVKSHAQITVSSNNYVGVGTPSPNEVLEVNGNIRGNQGGGALKVNAQYGSGTFGPQGSGYCHMYTDRPMFLFNQGPCSMTGIFGSFNTADLIFATGMVYSSTSGTTRMTIKNSTGYVGIGTTSPSYLLDVNGTMRVVTTTYQSDARLKDNIKDMSGALSSLVNLKGVTYKFIELGFLKITRN